MIGVVVFAEVADVGRSPKRALEQHANDGPREDKSGERGAGKYTFAHAPKGYHGAARDHGLRPV